jgi:hypothetical protein
VRVEGRGVSGLILRPLEAHQSEALSSERPRS